MMKFVLNNRFIIGGSGSSCSFSYVELTLITKQAQALEKLKRIENALIGHMAVDTQDPVPGIPCKPSRKARRAIPKPISGQKRYPIIPPSFVKKEVGFVTIQGRGDIYDPWGQPIYYDSSLDYLNFDE